MIHRNRDILCVLAVYCALGVWYSVSTPLWVPPDEEFHYAYCEHIARAGSLPTMEPESGERISQAFHPPLFYLAGSLLCPTTGAPLEELLTVNDGPGFVQILHPAEERSIMLRAHAIRLLSLLMGAVLVYYLFQSAVAFFSGDRLWAFTTALFAASIPQFIHVSASVSNEITAAALATLCVYRLMVYPSGTRHMTQALVVGVVLGAALLAKTSNIFLIPLTIVVIVSCRWRAWKQLLGETAATLSVMAVIAGWWYVQNWHSLSAMQTTQPWFYRRTEMTMGYMQEIAWNTAVSFFGYFGAQQVPLHTEHMIAYGLMLVLGAGGFVVSVVKNRPRCLHEPRAVLVLALCGAVSVFLILNYRYYAFLGKYLYVVMAPVAVIVTGGLRTIVPSRWEKPCVAVICTLCIVLSVDVLCRVIKPAFTLPTLKAGAVQETFCCMSPSVTGAESVVQTFLCDRANLCGVRVLFAAGPEAERKGTLQFEVGSADDMMPARRVELSAKDVRDGCRCYFSFPPIAGSRNRNYYFSISGTSATGSIGLWYQARDVYPEGCMVIDDNLPEGDLYFQTFCFSGEKPRSVWEGSSAKAIDQGLYITVREMQLYAEQRETFRTGTPTHAKYLQLEQAIKQRGAKRRPESPGR